MLEGQLVFLDTEFTSFQSPKLISIGLASSSGEDFYAEVTPFPEVPVSPFVHDVVVPLLGKDPQAPCSFDELHIRIRSWLSVVKNSVEITICFDSQYDETLFKDIFDGRPPEFLSFRNIDRNINELLRYEFHKKTTQIFSTLSSSPLPNRATLQDDLNHLPTVFFSVVVK